MNTPRWVARALLATAPIVALAGLVAEIGEYRWGFSEAWVELFSLSYEQNVPTWYASTLLFSCGVALASIARDAERRRAHWWGLSAIFFYMSLDEAVELHEHLGGLFDTSGVLYFSWVIPAAIIVVVIGIAFVPFLIALPSSSRTRFVIAGAIYVGGALAMELPLGAWTEAYGDDNLGYGLIDFVEETLELAGAGLFLFALVSHRGAKSA